MKKRFNPGSRILHNHKEWACIAIDGFAVAVFAEQYDTREGLETITRTNMENLFCVNNGNIVDNFKYELL